MPKRTLARIASATPGRKPYGINIIWRDGRRSEIDLAHFLARFHIYRPLLDDPVLFRSMSVGEYGTDIVWSDRLDIAAETLDRLAREQSGETMSAEGFRAWRQRRAFTLDGAADALGLSRRMVAYYEQGAKPVPRVVALATKALDIA